MADREDWKVGNEFLPFHPSASHVPPDYRDGWNACYRAALEAHLRAPEPAADLGAPLRHAACLLAAASDHCRTVDMDGERFDLLGEAERLDDLALAASRQPAPGEPAPFQRQVRAWAVACFGEEIANDKIERNHRFLEEALELVQALGCTASEAHQLVDYTYGRPVGDAPQEVGGVMTTLAALCAAHGFNMDTQANAELLRIWTLIHKIRAKQAAKPKHSPLPAAPTSDVARQPVPEFCCEASWNVAKLLAWKEAQSIRCDCDHNESCLRCWPVEFRAGGKWDKYRAAPPSVPAQGET